jgi:uncharacterized damage-inducible protein DinB
VKAVGPLDIHANLRASLAAKFDLLQKRSLAVVRQLTDEDFTSAPNAASNSVANLALHIRETVRHRVETVFYGVDASRDRDREFDSSLVLSKEEVIAALEQSFAIVLRVVETLPDHDFLRQPYLESAPAQSALNRESTVLDILLQMLAHLSEHVGQIFYIAKARLDGRYVTTTFPKKR